MQTRLLPPEQWDRLDGTELESVYPYLDRMRAQVIVVEDRGLIIGCWALFPLIHAEGIYISPEHRGRTAVARHLLRAMRATARVMGAQCINTAAMDDDVKQMLLTMGAAQLPGTHYTLSLGD
jgi:N-acetylglutamate synthase-like GNAT family acetyltransferase